MKRILTINFIFTMLLAGSGCIMGGLIPGGETALAAGAFLSALAGVLLLVHDFVYLDTKFHHLNLMAGFCLASSALGTLAGLFLMPLSSRGWADHLMWMGLETGDIAMAHLAVNLFAFSLMALAVLSRSLGRNPLPMEKTSGAALKTRVMVNICRELGSPLLHRGMYVYTAVVTLLEGYALLSNQKSFYSFNRLVNQEQGIDPLTNLTETASWGVVLILGILLTRLFDSRLSKTGVYARLFYVFSVGVQAIWFFSSGRRAIIFAACIFLLGMRLSWMDRPFRFDRRFKTVMICLVVIIPISWNLVFLTRMLLGSKVIQRDQSIVEILSTVVPAYARGERMGEINQLLLSNLTSRAFVIDDFALVIKKAADQPVLMGELFYLNLISATPRRLLPRKTEFPPPARFYQQYLGIPETDRAESFYVDGFLDLSWAGLVIYPVFFYCLFSGISLLAARFTPVFGELIGFSILAHVCMSASEGIMGLLFVEVRNLSLILAVLVGVALVGSYFHTGRRATADSKA